MTKRTAYLAIQCHRDSEPARGSFLYIGDDWRTGELASPVLADTVALYRWMDANGWTAEPYDPAHPCGVYAEAPAMVPQQAQQQQANAAPLYAFQVRGEDARPVAPRMPQDVEGITPRTVEAQTVAVRTRADWYAFSRACRTVARTRVEKRQAGESTFWAMIGGRVHRLTVERTSFGSVQRTGGGWRHVCHGGPVALSTARLTERPRRALIAAELDWAARYRANAMRDARERQLHRRAMSVRAVRACIAEARGLGSAFDRLPG